MTSDVCLAITLLTLKIAGAATLLIVPIGTALGWLFARKRLPGRALLESLLLLPMILPPVAVGLVLLVLMAPHGPLGATWEWLTGDALVLTWQAAALAAFVVALPLYVKAAEQAFAGVPLRLEQVALTLGESPWRIFRRVTLPLAARGLAAGGLLAFARALGEFGATNLVAGMIPGKTETLALGIYGRITNGHDAEAWVLAAISFAFGLGALLVSNFLLGRGHAARGGAR